MKAMGPTDKYLEMQNILDALKGESSDLKDSVEKLLIYLSKSEGIKSNDRANLLSRSMSMIEGIEELQVVEEKYQKGLRPISKSN